MAIYFQKFKLPEKDSKGQKHEWEHRAGLELLKEALFRNYQLRLFCMEKELSADNRGKPFLTNYPQIYFNISHGKDMVVCGVDGAPLGVDVEAVRPVKPAIFRRVLTKKEQAYVENYREKDGEGKGERDFFRLWTLKESYAKAVGVGLALDFTRLEFLLKPWGEKNRVGLTEGREVVELNVPMQEKMVDAGCIVQEGSKEKRLSVDKEVCRLTMREVEGRLDGEVGPWRFFQTIVEQDGQEYVISCCLSYPVD